MNNLNITSSNTPSIPEKITKAELRTILHKTSNEINNFKNEVYAKPNDFQYGDYHTLLDAINESRNALLSYERNDSIKGDRWVEVEPDITNRILSAIDTIMEKGDRSENYRPALNALLEFENELHDIEKRRGNEEGKKYKTELLTTLHQTSEALSNIKAEAFSKEDDDFKQESKTLLSTIKDSLIALANYRKNDRIQFNKWTDLDPALTNRILLKIETILERHKANGSKQIALKALMDLHDDLEDVEMRVKNAKKSTNDLNSRLQKTLDILESLSSKEKIDQSDSDALLSAIQDSQEAIEEYKRLHNKAAEINMILTNRILLAIRSLMERRAGEKTGGLQNAEEYLIEFQENIRDLERLRKDEDKKKSKVEKTDFDSL
jgi:hypothetical protein